MAGKAVMEKLTDTERKQFQSLEVQIESGVKVTLGVFAALMTIRDGRLYRESHGSFEEYCQKRWNFTRQYANLMISASQVAESIEPANGQSPVAPTQAKALVSVPKEKRQEVWNRAVESSGGQPPTAAAIKDAAGKPQKPAPSVPASKPKESPPVEVVVTRGEIEPVEEDDAVGDGVDPFDAYLTEAPLYKQLQAAGIPRRVFDAFRSQVQVWWEFREVRQATVKEWNRLTRKVPAPHRAGHMYAVMAAFCTLKDPKEWVVCGVCKGETKVVSGATEHNCKVCLGSGFLSR